MSSGRRVVQKFKHTYQVVNLSPDPSSETAANVLSPVGDLNKKTISAIKTELLKHSEKYDSIICTAGGFNGSPLLSTGVKITDPNFFEAYNQMVKMNVDSTLLSSLDADAGAHLATQLLKKGGSLILTGASGVYRTAAPDIMSYALAKNMVHAIAHNLSKSKCLPEDTKVWTILP